jgi:hypothetical protein
MARIWSILLVLAACGDDTSQPSAPDAEPGAPDAGPTATETRQLQLTSGQFVEAEFVAGPDDQVHIVMTAPTADLAWNIHTHDGATVRTIIEEDNVMMVDYWFDPDAQTSWWLMPGNSGTATLTVDVTIELYGAATFTGWL